MVQKDDRSGEGLSGKGGGMMFKRELALIVVLAVLLVWACAEAATPKPVLVERSGTRSTHMRNTRTFPCLDLPLKPCLQAHPRFLVRPQLLTRA
jgi:hypothetical protein